MRRFLVEEKVNVAQDLLSEALSNRRKLRPGILIRYYFHDLFEEGNPKSPVKLFSGIDRVELLRHKEPRVFLERLRRWVFGRECVLLPRGTHYKTQEARFEKKLKADKTA